MRPARAYTPRAQDDRHGCAKVASKGPKRRLIETAGLGVYEWAALHGHRAVEHAADPRAHALYGLPHIVKALRRAFLAREGPWAPGKGAIEGVVVNPDGFQCFGGGKAGCSYCKRVPNAGGKKPGAVVNPRHWVPVACFLDRKDRAKLRLFFVRVRTSSLAHREAVARMG